MYSLMIHVGESWIYCNTGQVNSVSTESHCYIFLDWMEQNACQNLFLIPSLLSDAIARLASMLLGPQYLIELSRLLSK